MSGAVLTTTVNPNGEASAPEGLAAITTAAIAVSKATTQSTLSSANPRSLRIPQRMDNRRLIARDSPGSARHKSRSLPC